jgi:hypothetical protein
MLRTARIALLGMGCLLFGHAALARGQQPPVPLPSTPAPAASRAPARAEASDDEPQIKAGRKDESITPIKQHDGLSEGGQIEVETDENTLTVTMTGVAAAHCWVGCESTGGQLFRLSQEFEITSPEQGVTEVELTLESTLKGVIRGRHKGRGCMRMASAAVYRADGPRTPLNLAHTPACAPGGCAFKYEREIKLPAVTVPLGKYVLVAEFFIEADATGLTTGHGIADFSDDPIPDLWKQERDPFKDVDRKEFGFVLKLTAEEEE